MCRGWEGGPHAIAWAFRQAAILVLSVLPLMGALRRTPAQAQAEFMAKMKAQQQKAAAAPEDSDELALPGRAKPHPT